MPRPMDDDSIRKTLASVEVTRAGFEVMAAEAAANGTSAEEVDRWRARQEENAARTIYNVWRAKHRSTEEFLELCPDELRSIVSDLIRGELFEDAVWRWANEDLLEGGG